MGAARTAGFSLVRVTEKTNPGLRVVAGTQERFTGMGGGTLKLAYPPLLRRESLVGRSANWRRVMSTGYPTLSCTLGYVCLHS